MKFISLIPIVIATLLLVSACGKEPNSQNKIKVVEEIPATTTISGGEIVTMEKDQPSAEAVVVSDDKIVFAGSLKEAQKLYPGSTPFDLDGKTLMPGFIEQHMHPLLGALTLQMVVIAPEPWELPDKTWPEASDAADYISKLKAAEEAMQNPSEILWTWGFNNFFHGELSRQKLDDISSTRPIVVWHRSCHEFYFNTAAIKLLGLNQADIDASGAAVVAQSNLGKGHFYEAGAMVYLLPRIFPKMATPERMKAGLIQMRTMLHQKGITAYMEPGAFIAPDTDKLYLDILGSDEAPFYSFFIPETKTPLLMHGPEGILDSMEQIKSIFPNTGKVRFLDKQIKILADGAIISQLMKMKDGYLDGHEGEWIQSPEEMETISKIFWEAGYQIHVHVNGDEGLDEVLDMFERRMKSFPREDHRGVLIHFANSRPDQIKRIKELDLIVSVNPYYVTGFSEKFAEVGLGKERAYSMVRLAPLEAQGTSISLHSDLPMAPADPLYLAWSAVTRQTRSLNTIRPELALSVDAAIRAITIDAAYSWGMEDAIGSIKAGKIANFTLINQNPYKVEPHTIKDIAVEGTFFEGKYFPVESQ